MSATPQHLTHRLAGLVVLVLVTLLFSGYASRPRSTSAKLAEATRPASEVPSSSAAQTGLASYYGERYQGRATASGEIFDMNRLTAAHRTLPFGAVVRVTNLNNDRSVVVRINDRGPFAGDRIIDLSLAAARQLDMVAAGVVRVRVEPSDAKSQAVTAASGEVVEVSSAPSLSE